FLFVTLLPELVLRLFTKNNPAYVGLTTPLRLFVLTYAIIFPAQVMQALFNGSSQSRSAFIAQCAFSIATLVLSLPFAAKFGLAAALWSCAFQATIYVLTPVFMLRRATLEARGFDVMPANGAAAVSVIPATEPRAVTAEGAAA